jgi:hypothetical protein
VELPFTADQFLDVFGEYNRQQWPLIAIAWLVTAVTILQVFRQGVPLRRLAGLTAVYWAWTAAVYHAAYFSTINRAAWLFAVIFLVQAYGMWRLANAGPSCLIRARPGLRQTLGAALMIYALLYPGLVIATGLTWPRAPLFAVPCPLTIFTMGLLVSGGRSIPGQLAIIPIAWAAVGTSAALVLGVAPDYALPVAGLILAIARFRPRGQFPARQSRTTRMV